MLCKWNHVNSRNIIIFMKISNFFLKHMPQINIKKDFIKKTVDFCDQHVSSPQQRLAIGVTALLTQPLIDYFNKNVDEKTRDISVQKTIAKTIVGMTTGYFIRDWCIKLSNAKIFKPDIKDIPADKLKNYHNAMGTFLATIIMLGTNFLIDAPLTALLTNGIAKPYDAIKKHFSKQKQPQKSVIEEVK